MDGNAYRFATSDANPKNYTTPVTDENAPIALLAARNAVERPFEVTDMSEY